eukprot:scaffold41496_cov26-Tisochrysis_lutea.AAC.4
MPALLCGHALHVSRPSIERIHAEESGEHRPAAIDGRCSLTGKGGVQHGREIAVSTCAIGVTAHTKIGKCNKVTAAKAPQIHNPKAHTARAPQAAKT